MVTQSGSGDERRPTPTPRRPTIHTIADAAGVSIATVSYVLNGRDLLDDKIKIGDRTRKRVLQVAEDLGYRANSLARGMRRGRTDQVCLALSFLGSPWTQAMIDAVSRAVHPLGYTTLLLVERDWQEFLARGGADAAVIHGRRLSGESLARAERLGELGVSLIALDCPADPVRFDVLRMRRQPAFDAVVELIAARHERIGCLRREGLDQDRGPESHYAGYLRALQRVGRALDPGSDLLIPSDRYRAYRAAIDLLDRPDRPTAILATSDQFALSVLWAAYRLGLDVPGQLEIVGVGNTPEGQQADPALTTIGARSVFTDVADLLVARLRHEPEPQRRLHYSDWSLFERGTTR